MSDPNFRNDAAANNLKAAQFPPNRFELPQHLSPMMVVVDDTLTGRTSAIWLTNYTKFERRAVWEALQPLVHSLLMDGTVAWQVVGGVIRIAPLDPGDAPTQDVARRRHP